MLKISGRYSKIIMILVLFGIVGCNSFGDRHVNLDEPLCIYEFNPFRPNHEIKTREPSIEEIVLSMNFLQRDDPFELMRYWSSQGFNGVWKGDDWVDLFEGEGDYPPIAVEMVPNTFPLNVKVVVWVRKTGAGKGSPYLAPFVRHEYILQLQAEGWRRKGKLVKSKPSSSDRTYLYDGKR